MTFIKIRSVKTWSLFLLFLFLPLFLVGENTASGVLFRGRVLSADNQPLDSVVILSDQNVMAVTDRDGRFVIEIRNNDEELTVYRYGYEIMTLPTGELIEDITIVLQREAMPIEGIAV